MQQLFCEPDDWLGPQVSSLVVRPDNLKMIVQARRSASTTPSGASRGGAELAPSGGHSASNPPFFSSERRSDHYPITVQPLATAQANSK